MVESIAIKQVEKTQGNDLMVALNRESVINCLPKLSTNNLYTIFKVLTINNKQTASFKKPILLEKVSRLINEDDSSLEKIYAVASEFQLEDILDCISTS